ncbi:hypothetical protein SERLADRAFT_401419 [Serpula lacrymans var. lacrymans S7.9]|uniref:Uncharacterized protein n=1 Tax=Serpula lacrymans var. lacrymans (strain S7.9) TaxID=578457 RepID=F8P9Z0_SERL9|nr:uncharacterized protein SERLADRAFT_401419 [Serpula lacrymans var. lacrymans S7.9]EGO19988.1 hypothetical protein SERLADRAFT_401419 [Serpula lacrymans var. lacrymans S7.9]
MDIRAHEDDVRNYITDRIRLWTRLNGLLSGAFREEVLELLVTEGQGIPLLFAELQEALAFSTGLRQISADDLVDKATVMDAPKCKSLIYASPLSLSFRRKMYIL